MYYLCSENKGADQLRGYPKGADQLRGYSEADLRLYFRICKKPVFSRQGSYINILSVVLKQFTSCFLWATGSLLCNFHQFSCFKGPAYAALIMSKQVHVAGAEHYIHVPSSVAQYVECPLRDREAPGSIPGRGTPKSLLMLPVVPRLAVGTQIFGVVLGLSV